MIGETLQQISGISIFPIVSLVIFTISFTAVVIWTLRLKDSVVEEMENMPFDDKDNINLGDK